MAFIFLFSQLLSAATIKVVTTIPEFAWVAKEIGGETVTADALLQGTENPHYVDALPSFIQKVAQADAVFSVGLDLEIGWLPKVLARSGNAQVQPSGRGYQEVGKFIEVLQKPVGPVDRSMGDVHPAGNPHFWLSPIALGKSSQAFVDTLAGLSPENLTLYQENQRRFVAKMLALVEANKKKLAKFSLKNPWLMEYHQEFSYFLHDYGIQSFDSVEEKPGVLPSAGRLAQVALAAQKAGIRVLLATEYSPKKTVARFSELSGIPAVVVPSSIQKEGKFKDYETLHNHIIDSLTINLRTVASSK